MNRLIDQSGVLQDSWVRYDGSQVPDAWIIAEWEQLVAGFERLSSQFQRLGVEVPADVDVNQLTHYLHRLSLVVFRFDSFADGRAFSQARLLRERLAFDGDIRATGQVLRDQLIFMRQCGFNQFELAQSEDVDGAIDSLGSFSDNYLQRLREPGVDSQAGRR